MKDAGKRGCPAWCASTAAEHDRGDCCNSTWENGVGLTWLAGEDITVWVDDYDDDIGWSVDHAEKVAHALLRRVRQARTGHFAGHLSGHSEPRP